jgi:hypothetical protein
MPSKKQFWCTINNMDDMGVTVTWERWGRHQSRLIEAKHKDIARNRMLLT